MAEQLGTVSIVQATLAQKKITKLGRFRKPTRVRRSHATLLEFLFKHWLPCRLHLGLSQVYGDLCHR